MEEAEQYRCRRLYLKPSDDPAFQATAACDALAGIDGILLAAPFGDHGVHIIYSLNELSIELVIELLGELEFELDDSILISLRNTIYGYLEANARDNMHVDEAGLEKDDSDNPEIPHQDNDKYWDDYC